MRSNTFKLRVFYKISLCPVPRVTLTDHNCISGPATCIQGMADSVVRILDHHADEGSHSGCIDENRLIAYDMATNQPLVGSVCTLVGDQLLKTEGCLSDEAACTALFAVICLDTGNMSPIEGRGTPWDAAVIKGLENEVPILQSKRAELFDTMRNSKFDPAFWNSLGPSACLQFDFKAYNTQENNANRQLSLGISSILITETSFLNKFKAKEALHDFSISHELDVLLVNSFILVPEPRRTLLVYAPPLGGMELAHAVSQHLINNGPCLKLKVESKESIPGSVGGGIITMLQQAPHYSRRIVSSILRKLVL